MTALAYLLTAPTHSAVTFPLVPPAEVLSVMRFNDEIY